MFRAYLAPQHKAVKKGKGIRTRNEEFVVDGGIQDLEKLQLLDKLVPTKNGSSSEIDVPTEKGSTEEDGLPLAPFLKLLNGSNDLVVQEKESGGVLEGSMGRDYVGDDGEDLEIGCQMNVEITQVDEAKNSLNLILSEREAWVSTQICSCPLKSPVALACYSVRIKVALLLVSRSRFASSCSSRGRTLLQCVRIFARVEVASHCLYFSSSCSLLCSRLYKY
ncbi:hypothetical protein VNO78_33016 [Psophocarpus tetragonolobus]|uniref:Uncharacterized protein n=1 Tax=Psophocarpus tetragonolobus TaxID=3891 RepID=A0AAN9P1E0_PSOTE